MSSFMAYDSHLKKMQELPEQRTNLLFQALLKGSTVIARVCQVLSILMDKRVTLEEKMIKDYLLKLAAVQAKITERTLLELAEDQQEIDQTKLAELTTLNDKIVCFLEEFLKAARYDLNYLEQYFEHKFYGQLKGSNFLEACEQLLAHLSCQKP